MQNREYYEKQLTRLLKEVDIHLSVSDMDIKRKSDFELIIDINNLLIYNNCVPFTSEEIRKLISHKSSAA